MASSPNMVHTYQMLSYLHSNNEDGHICLRDEEANLFAKAVSEGGSFGYFMSNALDEFFGDEKKELLVFASRNYQDWNSIKDENAVPIIRSMQSWLAYSFRWFKNTIKEGLTPVFDFVSIYLVEESENWEMSISCKLFDESGNEVEKSSMWFLVVPREGEDSGIFVKEPKNLQEIWKDFSDFMTYGWH